MEGGPLSSKAVGGSQADGPQGHIPEKGIRRSARRFLGEVQAGAFLAAVTPHAFDDHVSWVRFHEAVL
jgi:hypothetical protein